MKHMGKPGAGRILPVFLCLVLAAGLAGCGREPREASSSEPVSSPVSESASSGTDGEDAPRFSALSKMLSPENTDHFNLYRNEGASVRINGKLLTDIYEAIASSELTEYDVNEMDSYYEPDLIDFYYYDTMENYPSGGLGVYPPNSERTHYPTQTILNFSTDSEDNGHYIAPAELYDTIRALVDAQTFPSNVSFEGSYTELETPPNEDGEWLECFFDQNGQIAFLQGWRSVPVLEAATGKLLFTLESPNQVFRAEPHNGEIRLLTDNAIVDYGKDGIELNRSELPEEVRKGIQEAQGLNLLYRYDVAGDTLAYPTADGISLWENGGGRLLLDNGELPEVLKERFAWYRENETNASYTDPQLLAGGTRLCAVVNLKQSQNGYVGLVIVNLETGEKTYFWDLFGINRCGIDFPDDETVQTFAEAGRTEINAATLERSIEEIPSYSGLSCYFSSPDGAARFEERSYRDEEGNRCLDIFLLKEGSAAQKLCTIQGEECYRQAITGHYLLYHYKDNAKYGITAIPYGE